MLQVNQIYYTYEIYDIILSYTKSGQRSNMAVAEINALSGYRFDNDELDKLTGISDLQRVELENDDTKANIYFNPVSGLF